MIGTGEAARSLRVYDVGMDEEYSSCALMRSTTVSVLVEKTEGDYVHPSKAD